jgi:hypothetical protein
MPVEGELAGKPAFLRCAPFGVNSKNWKFFEINFIVNAIFQFPYFDALREDPLLWASLWSF